MIDPADESRVISEVRTDLFIGGQWRNAQSGATFPVRDPSTDDELVSVADGTAVDAVAALDAACAVQAEWAGSAPRDRSEILRAAYEALVASTDDLALVMTLEMGKPLADSRAEIAYAAEFFRWFAEEAVRIDGRYTVAPNGKGRLLVMHQPVGPCYFVTPWNFPLAMATRKIGPAVAAGCTMIVKPAQLTPLSMLAVAAILDECGLPPGVLNIVTSSDARSVTEPLLGDSRLRKLSFTGSTAVGKSLAAQAAGGLLRVSMELGGNAPFVVFGDADIEAAVDAAMIAKMRNMGEACTSANRFHVHESVAGEFTERLAERMRSMVVGRGTDDGVDVGPLVEEKARDKVATLVAQASDIGAKVVVGGSAPDRPGWFYEPTVLTDVPPDAGVLREEIFGPVAPVVPFRTDDEAVAAANHTEYGLVAYVFTRDLDRAIRTAESLEVGMVGLNQGLVSNPAAPFGGVKSSGFGREGGHEGIHEYLSPKYVALHT
ncbi:MAG: NAD-dependent succinate-semialdehyde dehydrogenase [Acidimicrobiales bacterium]